MEKDDSAFQCEIENHSFRHQFPDLDKRIKSDHNQLSLILSGVGMLSMVGAGVALAVGEPQLGIMNGVIGTGLLIAGIRESRL